MEWIEEEVDMSERRGSYECVSVVAVERLACVCVDVYVRVC